MTAGLGDFSPGAATLAGVLPGGSGSPVIAFSSPGKRPPGGYPWGQKLLYLKWPFFVHMIFGGFSYLVRYEKGRLEQIFGVLQIPT